MYAFVTGPLAWLAFTVFFVGMIARIIWYFRGLSWQLDRVAYKEYLSHGIKGAVRSIVFWLIPFGTHSWRFYPFFTICFFTFHIGLLFTPLFIYGHNILLQERWGFSLWSMPDGMADFMTAAVLVAALFIILRRNALPEVRIITKPYDYLVLAIAVAPFVTGLIARHQIGSYNFWLIAHILSGEIFLVAIPLTKLSHFIGFFLSRAQIGMDYGIKRGGMKEGGDLVW
jgi:nitrate reductase gamma subunit